MEKEKFKLELLENLTDNILPFWINKGVDPRGGFYGQINGEGETIADAPKGAILNARILWTFSASYRILHNPEYLAMANRAFDYLKTHFIDREHGGIFWSVDAEGKPLDTKKQFYALGFAIYGFSEYARVTGNHEAIELALNLFDELENHSRDRINGGYIEAATRDWKPIADMRLSDKDDNASKTMNTHLHILEPYTNLLRVVPGNEKLRHAVSDLIEIFFNRIEDPRTHHLGLFFDDDWRRRDGEISYGHDIEASWLLFEAAQVLGDPVMLEKAKRHTLYIAEAALEGRCTDGSMLYERHRNGHYDNDRHWWVQAETVIGQLYLWKHHGQKDMLDKAWQTWRYIDSKLVDHENGEWHWSVKDDGTVNRTDDKAGFWKCPYHNTRMCLESVSLL